MKARPGITGSCTLLTILFSLFTFFITVQAQPLTVEWQRGYNTYHEWSGGEAIKTTTDGGYVMAGYANTISGWGADLWVVKLDEQGNVVWEKSFAGSDADVAKSVLQTTDGGYIILGETNSANADATDNHGGSDIWIVRLDASGALLWKKCYGGTGIEHAGGIVQNTDGSYMVAGTSYSDDGDLAGVTLPATGILNWPFSYNTWLFKLSAQGNIIWQKAYGGAGNEFAEDIKLLPDGGYIVTGNTTSNDGDVSGNHGTGNAYLADVWVFRTDAGGNMLWQQCLGGSYIDYGYASIPTDDGGFALVGKTFSADGDVTGQHPGGWADVWVVKLDAGGNLAWQQCIGGTNMDCGMNIIAYKGSLLVSGVTASADGNVASRIGGSTDLWLTAFSLSGNLLWEKCYGGSNRDGEVTVQISINSIGMDIAEDGGLVMAAQSTSPEIPHITENTWSAYVLKFNSEPCDTVFKRIDTALCTGTAWPVTLTVAPGSKHYQWSTGDTTSSVPVNDTGIFWCVYGKSCPRHTDTFVLTYKPSIPVPDLGDTLTLCQNTVQAIGTRHDNLTFLWNTGATTCCILPQHSGLYRLEVSDGCTALSDSVYVTLTNCRQCLFIPNAFSPDGDGLNDQFGATPYCTVDNFRLLIYDRWGEAVFSAYNTGQQWDGTFKGRPMPVGTYFYYLTYTTQDKNSSINRGAIQLIR